MRAPVPHRIAALLVCALCASALAMPARAALAPPTTRAAADQMATSPGGRDRDRALAEWAKRSPLDDVLWVLRNDPGRLGSAEGVLVSAALKRMPRGRTAVAHQLSLRKALLDPSRARDGLSMGERERLRPRASVFRIASLLPDAGDYADFAASVHRGLETGLAWQRSAVSPPLEAERVSTNDEDPVRAVAAFDSVSHHCGLVVGALLSVPTLAVAAAARVLESPLLSPTATDESIGRMGGSVSQVGPGQGERGRVLARALVTSDQRVALVGERNALRGEFARSFAAEAESIGATLVRRETYADGGADFRAIARSLKAAQTQVAFWEGDPREAEGLVKFLASEGVRVQLCGGAGLAPEQHHGNQRALFEGVVWVSEDWALVPELQTIADSLARAQGEKEGAGSLWIRGFLAGRRIVAAIDSGARTPETVTLALRHPDPMLRRGGFLDCTRDGARLPLFIAKRGRTVEYGGP